MKLVRIKVYIPGEAPYAFEGDDVAEYTAHGPLGVTIRMNDGKVMLFTGIPFAVFKSNP